MGNNVTKANISFNEMLDFLKKDIDINGIVELLYGDKHRNFDVILMNKEHMMENIDDGYLMLTHKSTRKIEK